MSRNVLAELDRLTPELAAPDWTAGICQQIDPEVWFPGKGGTVAPAKQMCTRCPLTAQCLAWALATDQRFGVWGGTSERERRRLKRSTETETMSLNAQQPAKIGAAVRGRSNQCSTESLTSAPSPGWDGAPCPA